MAAAAAGDDGDLGSAVFAVDYLVGDVALHGGVCVGDGEEGGGDEVGWVVDEVFRCRYLSASFSQTYISSLTHMTS